MFSLLLFFLHVVFSIEPCRGCCQRRCCRTIFVCRFLVEQLAVVNVVFIPLLPIVLLMLSTMLSLSSANCILLMSGLVVELVVVHILAANFLLNNSSLMMLILLCFEGSRVRS